MGQLHGAVLGVLLGFYGCGVERGPVTPVDIPGNDVTASITPEPAAQAVPCPLELMASQVGVKEATNRNDGEEVESYLRSVGLGKGHPWCAAIMYWSFSECGYTFPEKPSFYAWSPNWFPSERVVWVDGRGSAGSPADALGIYYRNLGRVGHVGMLTKDDGDYFYTIEGNTSDAGSREGHGVYTKKRLKSQTKYLARWL